MSKKKCRCDRYNPEKSHWKFFQHLKRGGHIYRDDKLNNVKETLTPEILRERDGCICAINYYGLDDLIIIPTMKSRDHVKYARIGANRLEADGQIVDAQSIREVCNELERLREKYQK